MTRLPGYLRPLARLARAAGWQVSHSRRGGHIHFRSPSGRLVVASLTPSSEWRAGRNTRAELRRAGLS